MSEDHVPVVRVAMEDARADGRKEAAEEFAHALSGLQHKQENWISDILKVLPLVTMILGGVYAYTDLVKAVDKVSQRLQTDEEETSRTRAELVPIIRANQMAAQQGAMIDKQQSDRLQSQADSIQSMRASIELLANSVSKMHEDLAVEHAMRVGK